MTELERLAVELVQAKESLKNLKQELIEHTQAPDFTDAVGNEYARAIADAMEKVKLTYAAMASHVKAAYLD